MTPQNMFGDEIEPMVLLKVPFELGDGNHYFEYRNEATGEFVELSIENEPPDLPVEYTGAAKERRLLAEGHTIVPGERVTIYRRKQ
jgi:hypothetical protein